RWLLSHLSAFCSGGGPSPTRCLSRIELVNDLLRRRNGARLDHQVAHRFRMAVVLELHLGHRKGFGRLFHLIVQVGHVSERNGLGVRHRSLIAAADELMQASEYQKTEEDRDGDDQSLSLPRIFEQSLRRGDLARLKDFLHHSLRVDFLPRARIGAAVRTESRRGVDLVPTGNADCATLLRESLYLMKSSPSLGRRSPSPA